MKKRLIITLKSDLCVASGYSYAGVVDSDVCYDKYGLPYIPARRLKGCFRDTAENVLYSFIPEEQLKELFGGNGNNTGGNLRISNAKLRNYEKIKEELTVLKKNPEIGHLFTQQKVLEQYTHIVAQTAIGENSAAQDQSLRYTRVVNHHIPQMNGSNYEEMVFEAVIEYSENNFDTMTNTRALKLIVGATKNIGLKRNRGFGSVVCKIAEINEELNGKKMNSGDEAKFENFAYTPDMEYIISYTFLNDEPLMLSQLSNTHSEKYISGQTILGYLAGTYLKLQGKAAGSKEFEDLFLNGTTKYVNAYPAQINANGEVCIYYPAANNINRLKKTKDYVDTLYPIPENQPGNQPKKLKGKFLYQNITEITTDIDIKDVDMKLYYHHRKGDDSILYPSEAIEPEQIFAGKIYTSGKYVKSILKMLDDKDFYFGKSKTVQYGHCKCTVNTVEPVSSVEKYQCQGKVLVTLLTDAIFCETNEYTVEAENIVKQLCESMNGTSADNLKVMMETGLVSGYQTTWNMHKPLYPIVKAGSCFVLECKNSVEIPARIWVGTKNQEGYGYASVIPMKERQIKVIKQEANRGIFKTDIDKFKSQYCNILKKELLEELLAKSVNLSAITKTQISRAILMLKQSEDFTDFENRVNSIKTDSVRETLNRSLVEPIKNEQGENLDKLIRENTEANKYYDLLTEAGADLSGLWKDYLLYNLTLCKYEAKEA